jgi:Putative transposase, YhgA-like
MGRPVASPRQRGPTSATGRSGRRVNTHPDRTPLVHYRGDKTWQAEENVFDLIAPAPAEIAPYLPHLRYLLLDANAYPAAQLEQMRNPAACLLWLDAKPRHRDAADRRTRQTALEARGRRSSACLYPMVDPGLLAIQAARCYRNRSEEARGGKPDDSSERDRLVRPVAGRRLAQGSAGRPLCSVLRALGSWA